MTVTADASGGWRVILPPAQGLRLFGLSMTQGDRTVQSEGYLAIAPDGHAAQLRSGAAAMVFGARPRTLRILAVDYDRQGGAVISGAASPGADVAIAIDGVQRQTATDADGRFILTLNEPLPAGDHHVEAVQGAARVGAELPVSPAAPPAPGPFRAERTAFGWRIDWMTPGGGVQTTLMFEASESSS